MQLKDKATYWTIIPPLNDSCPLIKPWAGRLEIRSGSFKRLFLHDGDKTAYVGKIDSDGLQADELFETKEDACKAFKKKVVKYKQQMIDNMARADKMLEELAA